MINSAFSMQMVELFNPLAGMWPGEYELRLLRAVLEMWSAGCCLTGGCLRDHWYSGGRIVPKDIDIAVFDMDEADFHDFHCALESHGWVHKMTDSEQTLPGKEASDAEAERVDRVWQMQAPSGRMVDILLYAAHYQTEQEVVLSHDHSINMFCGYVDDDAEHTFRVLFPWGNMGRCYQMRDKLTRARCDHMRHVCQKLQLTYHDLIKLSEETQARMRLLGLISNS